MPTQRRSGNSESDEGYAPPINCPACGAVAHLAYRQTVGDGRELRVFECVSCDEKTVLTVS